MLNIIQPEWQAVLKPLQDLDSYTRIRPRMDPKDISDDTRFVPLASVEKGTPGEIIDVDTKPDPSKINPRVASILFTATKAPLKHAWLNAYNSAKDQKPLLGPKHFTAYFLKKHRTDSLDKESKFLILKEYSDEIIKNIRHIKKEIDSTYPADDKTLESKRAEAYDSFKKIIKDVNECSGDIAAKLGLKKSKLTRLTMMLGSYYNQASNDSEISSAKESPKKKKE